MDQPLQRGQSEKMEPVQFIKPAEPQNRNHAGILLPRLESPADRQRVKEKLNRAAGLAMDTMDTIATTMVSIGKVTKFPYLAESAGLVVTIIDIVASVKSNKEKFRSLARRTASIVAIIYQEEERGHQMTVSLQTKLAEVHLQLIEIARFVQKKLQEGKLLRAIQRKPDADAIGEYEKRLDHALNAFNFQAQINNTVVLDKIASRLGVADDSTESHKENMRIQSLQTIEDQKEELDKKQQEMEEELERKQAVFEQDKDQFAQKQAEWEAQREAAELVDKAKKEREEKEREALAIQKAEKEKRERDEAEARKREYEAMVREHDAKIKEHAERERKLMEEAEIADRVRRKKDEELQKKAKEVEAQKEAWKEGRQAFIELRNEENKAKERVPQPEAEASSRTRGEQENRRTAQPSRRTEQEERSYERQPDRQPIPIQINSRTRDEGLSTTMSNLHLSDSSHPPSRPRSWNPPSQLGSEDYGSYGSSEQPRKNPFNNPFFKPEIPRPQSAADYTDRSRRSARHDDSYASERQPPPRRAPRYDYAEEESYQRPPPRKPTRYDYATEESYQRPPPPRQTDYYEDEMYRGPPPRRADYYEEDDEDLWYEPEGYSRGPPIPPPVYPGIGGGSWINSGNVSTTIIKGSFNNTSRRPAGFSRYR